MRYVVTAEQMRELDRATIDEIGLPGAVLMENAGRAVARVVAERVDAGGRVAVVCGAGNNGGDGYVIARVLREHGRTATVYLAAPADKVGGDARLHLDVLHQCGGSVIDIASAGALREHAAAIAGADAVVDCVFGTGLARPVEGHLAAVIDAINRGRGWRVAVDVPSGLSADTGEVMGVAVRADATVTIAFAKCGLVNAPGFTRCGALTVAEIGIPADLARARGVQLALLEARDVRRWAPAADALDHKGTRGHVLVVAGSPGKRGAGRLSALGALRGGAGLVTLAGAGGDDGAPDPVMTAALDADGADAAAALRELAAGKRALAIGPGMPSSGGGRALVHAVLELDLPCVLDADALNHLGQDLSVVAGARARAVLTPHPGEAGRLLGTSVAEVEGDRVAAVRAIATATRAVVVLKGARTLVCDGATDRDFTTINPSGTPALATAGSGDVLTGVIAGALARGMSPAEAARFAVYVHGRAGELAAAARGVVGVIATDVLDAVPAAIAELSE